MISDQPDFYIASSEGYDMEVPRRCFRIKRLRSNNRDDLLLMRIDPPLVGQKFGLGAKDIDVVLIATRHKGESLFPVGTWPVCVHVARVILDNPQTRDLIHENELESIAWAEIYETEETARKR